MKIWNWFVCYRFAKDVEWADVKALEKRMKELDPIRYKGYKSF